jgi:NAD(P)-dependent dehydrogenase (short-subunit alcohol dehydrogenase family)
MADEAPLPNVSHDLTGQVALVTGATSGLGRRFARVLAAAGAKVIGTGRRVERLDEMVAEIAADGGIAVGVEMDMTDTDSILRGFEAAEAAFGTITILVNNAGIPDAQRAHKMSIELIDNVFDTNLRGPYVLSTEMAKRLIEQKLPGRQVNIASISATNYDGHGAALYSITKAGIVRMTEVLAVEWARNHINVTGIAPGAFHSEMMDGMIERMGDFSAATPRKRLGRPDQLDSTLLYLCSPASDAVTGTVIKVDDGQSSR